MTNEWQTVELRQVLKLDLNKVPVDAGAEYPMVGVYSFGRGLFTREPVSGNNTSYKFFYQLKAKHVVMSQLFGWEGALALSSDKFSGLYVSPQFPTFLCSEDKLDRKFLGLLMQRKLFWDDLGKRTKGMGDRRRTLNPESLLSTEIPLPSLDEQQHIVEYVEELATRIAKVEALREEADIETEALLASGTRKIFDKHSWKMISIEELVGRENLKNGKSLKSDEQPSEVSCLRISAMRNGKIDCKDTKPISMTIEEAKQYRVHINDVFVVRGNGSKELVGRAGLIEECKNIVIFPDLFIKVPLDETKILPTFFVAWWNSPIMREKIVDLAKTTSGIWKINQGHIASCEIPIPPLDEQRRIVAYLDSVQARLASLRELQSATGEKLSALLPSVLDRAFKGEL